MNSLVSISDRPDMTLAVYLGRKATNKQKASVFKNYSTKAYILLRRNFVTNFHEFTQSTVRFLCCHSICNLSSICIFRGRKLNFDCTISWLLLILYF